MTDVGFRELRGDRVVLRRFRADDAPAFAAYRSDPEVARYQGWTPPVSLADAERFIASLADEHPGTPGAWFQFALADVATDRLLGDVALHTHDDPRARTIGVTLARSSQGRGLATEALGVLVDHLLGDRGVHRITADCDPRNTAVVALLERLGMRREAHHLASYWDDGAGAWTDEYVYALLASERP